MGRGKSREREAEEEYDELNDDTFGAEAMEGLEDHPAGFPPSPSVARRGGGAERLSTPHGLLAFDSAVTIVKTRTSDGALMMGHPGGRRNDGQSAAKDDNDAFVEREESEAPPGLPSAAVLPPARSLPLTLADIEAKLSQSTLLAEEARRWFKPHSDRPAIITFPAPDGDLERPMRRGAEGEASLGPVCSHRHTMTRYEREGIARIHLGQLTTEHPELEDQYYRALSKRQQMKQRAGRTGGATPPLHLPLPTPRVRRDDTATDGGSGRKGGEAGSARERERALAKTALNEALANALGKMSRSSYRKPRQQLQVPPAAKAMLSVDDRERTSGRGGGNNRGGEPFNEQKSHFSLAASVEKLYEAAFAVEDVLEQEVAPEKTDSSEEQLRAREKRREASDAIRTELFLNISNDVLGTDEVRLSRFLALMALPKAERALSRALRAADDADVAEALLRRLVDFFEYLPACRPDASPADVHRLINTVLAALVPFVACMDEGAIAEKLELLSRKGSLPWVVSRKAGMVLCCILLSRLEILKNSTETATALPLEATTAVVLNFFDLIQDRLADCFAEAPAAALAEEEEEEGGSGEAEFYGWQFMALLAMNVDADRKRSMVMELRERILAVVERNDPKAIGNLNIFLNVLGLDASQLSV